MQETKKMQETQKVGGVRVVFIDFWFLKIHRNTFSIISKPETWYEEIDKVLNLNLKLLFRVTFSKKHL